MAYNVDHFRTLFFEESADHLAVIEAGLLALEGGDTNPELVHAVFRAAHSIKGVASSLGLSAVAEFTHLVESVLGRLRDGTLESSPAVVALLVHATDALRALIGAAAAGDVAVQDPVAARVGEDLARVLAGTHVPPKRSAIVDVVDAAAVSEVPRDYTIRFVPHPRFFRTGQDPLLLLRELTDLGMRASVVTDESRLPAFAAMEPQSSYLGWTVALQTSASRSTIEGVFVFVEDACDLDITETTSSPVAATPNPDGAPELERRVEVTTTMASLRVSAAKVDALVDLVGELTISQAMVNQLASELSTRAGRPLLDALSTLDRQTRELQERVMAIRMLPVETVFSRFARLTRDLASQLDKRVALETTGAETELDKAMLERLGDPLTHLVRNSIDHGIESPAERRAQGKPEEGTITLRAFHESGSVVIEVADDGRGLDLGRIREKARAQGLVANETLSDDDVIALIFEPGFSTTNEVTALSGRGVGMDVVKRAVEALKGSIAVTSTPGQGSRTRIRLPLTLAVMDGLVVRVAGQAFVIPMSDIIESLRPSARDIRDLLGMGETIELRGESRPFLRLASVFHLRDAITEPSLGIVVVLESDGKRFGLLVDEVIGEQQVVIKSLEKNFRAVDGAMAATILGDGRVALIVDVNRLSVVAAARPRAGRVETADYALSASTAIRA